MIPFAQGEKRELYYDSNGSQRKLPKSQAGEASDPVTTPQYDMQLTFADQSVLGFDSIPV